MCELQCDVDGAAVNRVLAMPRQRWTHACNKHEGNGQFCKVCGYRDWLHRVKRVGCSSCGGEFLPREGFETGYSMCDEHRRVF